jgi:hypothetical protein
MFLSETSRSVRIGGTIKTYAMLTWSLAALYRILDLHNPSSSATEDDTQDGLLPAIVKDDEPIWKVLILDKAGMSIVSSVLRVADLRSKGVTIHLSIASKRAMIPDVSILRVGRVLELTSDTPGTGNILPRANAEAP